MILLFVKKIKFVHARLEHVFNASVGAVLGRKHSLTGCLNAALIVKPGKMNNTLSLLESDFRITVLKNKFCDVSNGLCSDRLRFLASMRIQILLISAGTLPSFRIKWALA